MVAMNDIQAVVDRIAEAYDPQRIVLFGSHARGTATSDSDVDLLVILPFEGRPFWKSLEITNRVNPHSRWTCWCAGRTTRSDATTRAIR